MSNLMPQGEMIRRAAAYVAEEHKEKPTKPMSAIIDEAGMKFNLPPLDCEALARLFSGKQ